MPLAGLILLAWLGPINGARAQSQTNGTVVPIAALAAAEVGSAGAARMPARAGTNATSLALSSPLIGKSTLLARLTAWKQAPGLATRGVLGRLGNSIAAASAQGRAASAEPIAEAMDGSEGRPEKVEAETSASHDAAISRLSRLTPAVQEAPTSPVQEPPAPQKPWKAKAKKGAHIGAGWILLVLGTLLWVLPIPGPTGLIIGGLALLAKHYTWAAVAQARVLAYTWAMPPWVLARLRLRGR